ncbi:proteasome-type protease [Nisaea acidiphila]|uniref:Proteasome-type protease n=1 Tax=Nisaea acidiphila TaxID=1862145 RepID=A0A9J7AUL6_9PROT|nr:proteasome-type protease [Nisaea acidiphila]UUX51015.1 proteasome-type protease [Nisaea acidiphila]
MTYCVGLRLEKGLVFMSDTRTNSGVDNISQFKKLFTWAQPGERVITMLTAGNLATTQTVVSLIDERTKAPEDRNPSILEAPSMFDVARQVGAMLRDVIRTASPTGERADSKFDATIILGGQIRGGAPRLFMIYPEGNFLEASEDTPFFQIGETKYGRPIILRAYEPTMSFEEAVKLLFVSFDSTIKANLSVGLPLDLQTYESDSFEIGHQRRVTADDPYYMSVSQGWGDALKSAFNALPDFHF